MDIYQSITDKLVAALEACESPWDYPWNKALAASLSGKGGASLYPTNVTGYAYRGVNVLVLWCAADELGYPTQVWGTYRQWQAQGAQVRKGEKGQMTVFWKRNTYKATTDEGEEEERTSLLARCAFVFNAAQVEGYEPKAAKPKAVEPEPEDAPEVKGWVKNTGAVIKHGGDRAFYRPATDSIQMPPRKAFKSEDGYWSTLLHELTHWTGAATRCNRQFGQRFGDEAYAFEELVAEMGAAFLCADLRVSPEPRADHAAYLKHWLNVLKADKRAIFTAASKAQAAAKFLHDLQDAAAVKAAA
jgi:antirestriction protein ArdC